MKTNYIWQSHSNMPLFILLCLGYSIVRRHFLFFKQRTYSHNPPHIVCDSWGCPHSRQMMMFFLGLACTASGSKLRRRCRFSIDRLLRGTTILIKGSSRVDRRSPDDWPDCWWLWSGVSTVHKAGIPGNMNMWNTRVIG